MPYFPPGQSDYNFLRHLMLIIWDTKRPITAKELSYNLAYYKTKGKPKDWFFDSLLSLMTRAPSGNYVYADVNRGTTRSGEGDFFAIPSPNPANAQDWLESLDSHFVKEGILSLLESEIRKLKSSIGYPPSHKRNVIITIPYPHPNQSLFGKIENKKSSLNFSITGQNLTQASEQRLEACKWFVDQTITRWKRANYKNLHLLGFYWIYESLHYSWEIDDHWVLKELYKYIQEKKYKFFWIPFYSSYNVHLLSDYQNFYFDCAFLQPNHMFYKNIKDVREAVLEAKKSNSGIEMEYHMDSGKEHKISRERHRRFRNYLDGGVKYGYMTESACAYFMGFNDIYKMAVSKNKQEESFYHDLYHFVQGDYQIP